MDLREALRALHGDFLSRATDQPVAPVVAAARRRRIRARAGYGAVGAGAIAALVLGGSALANRQAPLPPAVTTPAPAPTTSAPEPSSPTPTASQVVWRPDLSRCGTAGQSWTDALTQPDATVWVGNYWGPDAVDSADSWSTWSDAIWGEDHGGSVMTVEVLDAVVAPRLGYSSEGELQAGDVLAVLGEPIAPFDVTLSSGSEGGGGGSSAAIETRLPLALCDDASRLPDGEYVTVTRYRLTIGGQPEVVYGESEQRIGDAPEAPSLVSTLDLAPPLAMPSETYTLDMGRCGEPTDDLDAVVTADPVVVGGHDFQVNGGYTYAFIPYRSGQQRLLVQSGSGWVGEPAYGYWPKSEASQVTVLDAVVATTTPGTEPIWGQGEKVTSGRVIGLLSGPMTPWQRPPGQLELDLPITWCDGSTTAPDGQLAVYVKVQENVSGTDDAPWATTGVYWIPMLFAVGQDAYPYSPWPY